MKILLVIPSLPLGGAERVMSVLANEFVALNHEVHLVLLAKDEIFYTLDSRIVIHQLGFENKGKVAKIISEIRTYFALRKLIKKQTPDVVLSFMVKYNIFTILASLFLKTKVFVSDRCNPNKKIPWLRDFLRDNLYKKATGVIAQTQLAKSVLMQSTKHQNIKVIHNPLKQMEIKPYENREKIILNVGRLAPEKGQLKLIEEFCKIEQTGWKLMILGDGPLYRDLQAKIQELNAQSKVVLEGAVSDVESYLQRASIFVFSSFSEGFPNALAEAMCSGLPCISFDCEAGPNEIITNGENGILVPVGDFNSLRRELETLINNSHDRERLAAAALKTNEDLAIDKITEKYLSFFKASK
jgi:GalNAc-alpha-(1->4)-GalNAc-alpha-(1->3)-diNAcBac-PP-undecaprenol alpha-1,4-N-acetyl-D-galactosaminyltransferase